MKYNVNKYRILFKIFSIKDIENFLKNIEEKIRDPELNNSNLEINEENLGIKNNYENNTIIPIKTKKITKKNSKMDLIQDEVQDVIKDSIQDVIKDPINSLENSLENDIIFKIVKKFRDTEFLKKIYRLLKNEIEEKIDRIKEKNNGLEIIKNRRKLNLSLEEYFDQMRDYMRKSI